MLGLAWGLHFLSQWGRRAEDPFRGLRAGPVRYSPLSLSPIGDPESFPGLHRHPHNTPRMIPNTAKVCLKIEKPRWELRETSIELRRRERCEPRVRLTRKGQERAGRDGLRRAEF